MSGANSTPLGRMNPAIGAGKKTGSGSLLNPSYLGSLPPPPPSKPLYISSSSTRDYDMMITKSSGSNDSQPDRKKRRKSRWQGSEKEKTFIPGMPTVLPSNMNKDQEEAYLLQLQIEELSRRLRSNDLGIPPNPDDRSPSPEPIYNNEGKRLNTREYRTRKRLEDERHGIIQKMNNLNPEYKPPADYKPPLVKVSDKVMIPQDEHPDINFVGLLIGPRGNTLKSMEKDTGAKVIIRGKGSVKEGKVGRKDGGPMPGEDEPLHAYVTASNPEAVKKAVDKIKDIIRQGVEVPEGQNDLRRMQLRELALLNGTLRENDGPRCTNCGSTAHKLWQCPDKPNVTNNVVCSSCGGAGHISKDCRQRKPGFQGGNQMVDRQKIDEEYMSLMAELGEGPPPKMNENRGNHSSPHIRGLFDNSANSPRAIMAPQPHPHPQNGPQGDQMRPSHNGPPMNMGGPPMRNQQGGPPEGVNWQGGPNNGGGNPQQFNRQTNRMVIGGSNNQQQPCNRPPPINWQNSNQNGGFNQGPPPPNLLAAPPPPPPPPVSSNQQQQQPQNMQQQQQQQWGVNPQGGQQQQHPEMNWQGGPPQGMGCPPPGPVPAPPRPGGPPAPPGWGWNGGGPQMGPPGANVGGGGPPTGKQMDLGAFLWNSAPPPPPPPQSSSN